jgi:hypothetical protein
LNILKDCLLNIEIKNFRNILIWSQTRQSWQELFKIFKQKIVLMNTEKLITHSRTYDTEITSPDILSNRQWRDWEQKSELILIRISTSRNNENCLVLIIKQKWNNLKMNFRKFWKKTWMKLSILNSICNCTSRKLWMINDLWFQDKFAS